MTQVDLILESLKLAQSHLRNEDSRNELAHLLIAVAELERLRSDVQDSVGRVLEEGRSALTQMNRQALEQLAAGIDTSNMAKAVEYLESCNSRQRLSEEEATETDRVLDDLFYRRDQLHLLMSALQRLGIAAPDRLAMEVQSLDERALGLRIVKEALPWQESMAAVCDPAAIEGLWWFRTVPIEEIHFDMPPSLWDRIPLWLSQNPAPAMAAAADHTAAFLELPEWIWAAGTVLGYEVAVASGSGRLWLWFSGVEPDRLRIRDLELDGESRSALEILVTQNRLLIPLDPVPIRSVHATVSDGNRTCSIVLELPHEHS
jgi:hypothetical protein